MGAGKRCWALLFSAMPSPAGDVFVVFFRPSPCPCPFLLLLFLHFPSLSANSSSAAAASAYIGAAEFCAGERDIARYCNLHNPTWLCICYSPAELVRPASPLCSRLLRLHSLEYSVLTISVSFPVPASFRSDPDSIFVEDLELFAGFARSSIFILRRGCSADRSSPSFQFQFGILRGPTGQNSLGQTDLRLIHPRMFTQNANFMRQKGLLIASVEQPHFLRPLLGFSSASAGFWGDDGRSSVGLCRRRDPRRCYAGEMALAFLVSLFAGAELARTMFWRIFAVRHGRGRRE